MGKILWRPRPEQVEAAAVTSFRREINERYDLELESYADLWEWSVADPAPFWESVWRFCDVRASRPHDAVLVDRDRMPGARWFPGARLNFAENLLRRRDGGEAIVSHGECGVTRRITYAGLRRLVARTARALAGAGIRPGDRVAALLPNVPEAVVGMLAAASLGAIWSSCSPDFGAAAVTDRFGQIEPKLLLAGDGALYRGRRFDSLATVRHLASRLPGLERIVVVPVLEEQPDLSGLPGALPFDEFLAPESVTEIDFAPLPFDHPLYILYSSGTTGLPKCMVHGAGGTLLQHLKEHRLHCDLGPGDRLFYFTTCGWMMWNWLASGLASGTTLVLYDGSPVHPSPDTLWALAERERITVLGTSARYLAAQDKAGVRPGRDRDLSPLQSVLSTGSPLAPETFDYVYRDVKGDVRLSSISGGTDILSCFALGCPVLPVVRGEIQCRGLGMRVEVYDDTGRPLEGAKGELVCSAPFPSMPVAFWKDPDRKRYEAAYFQRFPGVWTHGDFAEIRPGGGMVIHGRSDAVLNPGGVRIGTAEIYRIVEGLDAVLEAVAVGQEWKGDVRVVLFVRLRPGRTLDEGLRRTIRDALRKGATPRHVPARILQVDAVPRTRSGKISEIAVREAIHGRPVRHAGALANPQALDLYRDLPALREGGMEPGELVN